MRHAQVSGDAPVRVGSAVGGQRAAHRRPGLLGDQRAGGPVVFLGAEFGIGIQRALGHQLPHGDFQTIAGLVIATHRELPDAGQVVRVELPVEPREVVTDDPRRHALDIEVLEVANRVPAKVLVHVVELDDDNPVSTADNNGADHNHDDDNADRDAPTDRSSDAHGMSDLPGEPDARDESGDEAGR